MLFYDRIQPEKDNFSFDLQISKTLKEISNNEIEDSEFIHGIPSKNI